MTDGPVDLFRTLSLAVIFGSTVHIPCCFGKPFVFPMKRTVANYGVIKPRNDSKSILSTSTRVIGEQLSDPSGVAPLGVPCGRENISLKTGDSLNRSRGTLYKTPSTGNVTVS